MDFYTFYLFIYFFFIFYFFYLFFFFWLVGGGGVILNSTNMYNFSMLSISAPNEFIYRQNYILLAIIQQKYSLQNMSAIRVWIPVTNKSIDSRSKKRQKIYIIMIQVTNKTTDLRSKKRQKIYIIMIVQLFERWMWCEQNGW